MFRGRVVGSLLEHEGRYLLLLRAKGMKAPGKWGLPAGKQRDGETDEVTVIRETAEETAIDLAGKPLTFVGEWDWENQCAKKFTFVVFAAKLNSSAVTLNPVEHEAYRWVTPQECMAMEDLLPHVDTIFKKAGLID